MLALLLSAVLALASASLPPNPNYAGLKLVYADDFLADVNAPAFTGNFNVADNFVQTPYGEVCYTKEMVRVENGNLIITTKPASITCAFKGSPAKPFSYISGWVDSFGKLTLPTSGLIEVHSKLPPPVYRIWPAAWVIDQKNARDTGLCWPLSIEADIYEMTGGLGNADICGSQHWGTVCNVDRGDQFGCRPRATDDGFHTYVVHARSVDCATFPQPQIPTPADMQVRVPLLAQLH